VDSRIAVARMCVRRRKERHVRQTRVHTHTGVPSACWWGWLVRLAVALSVLINYVQKTCVVLCTLWWAPQPCMRAGRVARQGHSTPQPRSDPPAISGAWLLFAGVEALGGNNVALCCKEGGSIGCLQTRIGASWSAVGGRRNNPPRNLEHHKSGAINHIKGMHAS